MISRQLPKTIDPFKFVQSCQSLVGELSLADMQRLKEACRIDQLTGLVKVELNGMVEQGIEIIQGHFVTILPIVCQRCLQSFNYPVDIEVALALVREEELIKDLPSCYEPLIASDPMLDLSLLIEGELLLYVPIVGLHPIEACTVKESSWHFGEIKSNSQETRPKPFAKLSSLKKATE